MSEEDQMSFKDINNIIEFVGFQTHKNNTLQTS